MPSTYSTSLRLVLQATGEGLNVWGTTLNDGAIALTDAAIAGRAAFALSGSKTLTSSNGATDEARQMILDVTSGSGGTITAPAVSKIYLIRNASSGDVIITTGGGTTATVASGVIAWVMCDGTNFRLAVTTDFQGAKLVNVGTATVSTDGVNKAYADGILASANSYTDSVALASGNLPSTVGQDQKYLFVSAGTPAWQTLAGPFVGNLTGNVTGNLTGNSNGTHTGAVAGTTVSASGGFTGNLVGNVTGNVSGNASTSTTAVTATNLNNGFAYARTPSTVAPAIALRADPTDVISFLQFTNTAPNAIWHTISAHGAAASSALRINNQAAVRVVSGTAGASGLISWGTAAPGALAEGEIYLQYP